MSSTKFFKERLIKVRAILIKISTELPEHRIWTDPPNKRVDYDLAGRLYAENENALFDLIREMMD